MSQSDAGLQAAATDARRWVLGEWPYAYAFECGKDGRPCILINDGIAFDASGHLGEGPTEDDAWLDAASRGRADRA